MKAPTETEKAQHTAEPWSVGVDEKDDRAVYILSSEPGLARDRRIARMDYRRHPDGEEANAKRIIACVNACQGIPDPASALPALVGALQAVLAAQQVCEETGDWDAPGGLNDDELWKELRAAIALAQGGKR